MPKKITQIRFYNYKAFYSTTADAYTIDLDKGKNLLIYGENGSGKSSIFDGLKDFFLSSEKDIEFNQNIFSKGSIPQEPFIEVAFTDEAQPFSFSSDEYKTNTSSKDFIKDANKVKSFLSYKNLLAIHYFRPNAEVNIFDILFSKDGILYDFQNPVGKAANKTDTTLGALYKKIVDYSSERRGSIHYKDILNNPSIVSDFNLGVTATLKAIKKNTNKFLHTFNQKFYLKKIEYIPLTFTDVKEVKERLNGAKLKPHLYFLKKDVPDYNVFLNEARLTALSLSIYFSAVKVIPRPIYQILFLDDIFLGLDTSNRIPLLKILKEHFLQTYQIIITTYDRYWYEIAKDQLGIDDWHTAEMFTKDNSKCFEPVIIQPSEDYHKLAKKYYDAKDYPACGNYQRKACEKYIKAFIPLKMQLQENEDGSTSIVKLEALFTALKKYIKDVGLNFTPFANYALYKRLILNTLSHDDLKSPYYKSELEEMFTILDELNKLKRIVILKTDEFVFLELIDSAGNTLKFDLKVKDNLVLLKQGSDKKFQRTIFATVNKHINNTREDFNSEEGDLPLIYKNICHYLGITPVMDIYSQFKDKDGKILSSF